MGRQRIDEYTMQLLNALETATEEFISWAKPHQMAKAGWTEECTQIVKETRRLRRGCRTSEEWVAYVRACDHKGKVLRKHKRNEFRRAMQASEESSKRLFNNAKWARNAVAGTLTQAMIPPLKQGDGMATTAEQKAEVMFQTHFPPSSPSTLSAEDFSSYDYPQPMKEDGPIIEREIVRAIYKAAPDKAPDVNGVTNRALRHFIEIAATQKRSLFERCYREGIQPAHFKRSITIILRKPGKKDYSEPKSYRPIALLDTLGKTLESIISKRLRYAVEKHGMLSDTQMGARKHRSVNTALQLITEKIHTIWSGNKKRIASLLSLDVSGAFDNVSHIRLLHNMRRRRAPEPILKWVEDFLKDRRTSLTVGSYTQAERGAMMGIPQGSPLSPVLYLFYNADLLEMCDDVRLRTSATGFVDDINILAYSESTERNCQILKQVYDRCEEWAQQHGSKFAESKHELIHFSRTPKRYNMNASLILTDHEISAKADIRVLGVQLDSRLRWRPHLRQIEAKLVTRQKAAQIIAGSTWGSSTGASKRIYSAVSRSVMSHGAAAWYTSAEVKGHRKGVDTKLRSIQGRALRQATGAYRATATEALQVETNTIPIDTHLKKLVQRSMTNMDSRESGRILDSAVERIKRDVSSRRGRKSKLRATPLQLKRRWVQNVLRAATMIREQAYIEAPWVTPPKVVIKDETLAVRHHNADRSNSYWRAYSDGSGRGGDVTAAAVGANWSQKSRLGGVEMALTHHGELEGLTAGAERLAEHCQLARDCKDRVYKVYFDSQASLKVADGMLSTTDQSRLRRLQRACEKIRVRGASLELHWIPGHKGIKGNEAADTAVNEAHTLPPPLQLSCEPAARKALARSKAREAWKKAWREGTNGTHYRKLAPEITHRHARLHDNRPKAHSALLTQLRTGKIGFNQFLCERRIPEITTGTCSCGLRRMTVKHILLTCSN